MKNFNFILKTRLESGVGSLEKIKPFLLENNFRRIGFITDQALASNAAVSRLKELINQDPATEIAVDYIYDLPFEPDYDSLDRVKLLFKSGDSSKVDAIIVAGGGSAMDFAKGIATLIANHENAISYRGFPKNINPSLPLIAIPSTAGTASEVTFNAVFINKTDQRKLGINTHNNFPVLAVLDPELVKGCPYPVALSSGLDALVHTLESFAAKQHTPVSRIFAVEAFRLLINNIEKALKDKDDASLLNMQLGAYLAGVSLMNAGSGPAGAISYPLGVVFSVPHGIAGGIILPFLLRHNISRKYTDYEQLFAVVNENELKKSAVDLGDYFFKLYKVLKVWDYVKKINVTDPAFREYIGILQGAFDQNPVPFSPSDAFNIMEEINSDYIVQ